MQRHATGHLDPYDGKNGRMWRAKIRLPDGTQRKIRIGPHWDRKGRPPTGYFTRQTALVELRELLVDADKGDLDVQRVRSGVTLRQAVDEWLHYIEFDRKRRHSTVLSYRSLMNGSVLAYFDDDRLIDEITEDDIDAYRKEMLDKGRAGSTINKHLNLLAAVFKRAIKSHGLRINPCVLVDRQPHKSSGNIDVYSPQEVMRLSRVAEEVWHGLVYTVAAFTGLRMSELRNLRWEDIDFAKRLVHVRKGFVRGREGDPKSNRVRSVPLVDQAKAALLEQRRLSSLTEAGDLVFPNGVGKQFDDSKLRKAYHRAQVKAKLKRVRFHDLRHTFGTLAVQVFAITDVQAFMGHADISTTMIYVHHKSREDDAERLSTYIADQARESLREVKDDEEEAA